MSDPKSDINIPTSWALPQTQTADFIAALAGILGSPVNIASGGTGAATAKAARDNIGVTTLYNYLSGSMGAAGGRNLQTLGGYSSAANTFAALRALFAAGNFNDVLLGDYIDIPSLTVGGTVYTNNSSYQNLRVVFSGADVYKGVGDTEVTAHHGLFMFKNCVYQAAMNDTAINAGGYPASSIFTALNGDFLTGLASAIGITPYTIHRLLDNYGTWEWVGESVFIPTEVEVFGHQAWSKNLGYSTGTSIQWPIFSRYPSARIKRVNGSRYWWWEASPRSDTSTDFCICDPSGDAYHSSADITIGGVSPAFII